MNKIRVTGGSVQLRLDISGSAYHVDVWKEGARWKWTSTVTATGNFKFFGTGERERWSDARTASFRACAAHAAGKWNK